MRAIVRNEALRQEQGGEVLRLRAQLERVQGRRLDAPVLPTHSAFSSLLPGGGLRPGAAYSLGRSASMLLALMARPSQDGSWCAAIGMPELGVEAAESLGVDLARLVFVPDPGPRWLAVTATIAEVAPVVAVRPPTRAADGEIARLGARLRDRGTVLLVQGPWPQAEATLEVGDPEWSGVGRGHGYLDGRTVTVTASSRRWPRARRERMLLPGPHGEVALAPAAVAASAPSVTALPPAESPAAAPVPVSSSVPEVLEGSNPAPHAAAPSPAAALLAASPSSVTEVLEGSNPALLAAAPSPAAALLASSPSPVPEVLEGSNPAAVVVAAPRTSTPPSTPQEEFQERLRRAMRILEAVG